ncbi:MAG TPA: pitrilysin family protein [Thermoanaerobaculia bacterium]
MNRMKVALAALLLFAAGHASAETPVTAKLADVKLPRYEQVRLPNGLTLLLMERHDVPLIAFHGRLRGGALADPQGKEGVGAIAAELIQKGSGKRNAQQFAEAVDSVGGQLSVSAGREATTISAEFMAKDRGLMLELLSDILRRPSLPKEEFEKVSQREIESIRAAKDGDPRNLVPRYFNAFLFASHPYGRAASESSLGTIAHEDVANYVRDQFGADRAIFAFVGAFDAKSFAAEVRKTFGDWKKASGALAAAGDTKPATGRRVLLVDKPDATQTYFSIGNVGMARTDSDRVLADVANIAFGGRFTSMLNTELRIKSGLSYGASSSLVRETKPGTVSINSYTKTETTGKALDLALEVLGRLRSDGLDATTLASVQRYAVGQFPPTLETGGQLAARLTELSFYGLDRSDVETYASKIQSAEREGVQRVINRLYPAEENLTFVLVGNAAEIREVAKKYGEVTEIKITDPRFAP